MTQRDVLSAVNAYHQLLETDKALAEASAAMLAERQPGMRLTFGGKPLCAVLRPHFLSHDTYLMIQRVCSVLSGAMFRLAAHIPKSPELQDFLALTPEERDLVGIDPGYGDASPTSRLDSFMAGDRLSFVEYNAETPAAIAYEDALSELFTNLPIMREFARTHECTPLPARDKLLNALLGAYREWGGRGRPNVAVVDWSGLPTATEHQMFAEYFEENGMRAIIAEPGALEYDGQRLSVDGLPIDLVYRRVLTAELLRSSDAGPLLSAYRDRRVCIVNSFRSKLLHKKATFALLSDERFAHYFTKEEQQTIEAHIPWTRVVSDSRSTYAGDDIDLLQFAGDNRHRLVLKPNDEYGGKGVVIGWESSADEWDRAIMDALREPCVVQERAPVDGDTFPMWRDGLEWVDLTADLDPFLFGTQVGGMLTRLSAAALLNVTAGTGSIAPTFLVKSR